MRNFTFKLRIVSLKKLSILDLLCYINFMCLCCGMHSLRPKHLLRITKKIISRNDRVSFIRENIWRFTPKPRGT